MFLSIVDVLLYPFNGYSVVLCSLSANFWHIF